MQPTDVSIFSLVWQQFWQCSALVLTVWLVCRLVRFRRSHLTCLLWLVVLLKFMTPPVWDSSMGLFCWIQNGLPAKVSPSQPPDEPEILTRTESMRLLTGDDMGKLPVVTANPDFKVTIHENETMRQTPVRLETTAIPVQPTAENSGQPAAHYSVKEIGVLIWMTVGLLIATMMLVRYLRCWHIIRRAGEQSHPELNRLLERLCAELKLKRRVRLLITHSRMGPAVIGLLRPIIILPTAITESRSLKELEPVLAHELIHIRRGDLWIGLLQLLASVVWWFHPLVWFTGRRLKFEIEQCCDEEVLAELNCDPRQYAACLLEILELKQTLTAVPVVPGVRPVEITSKRLERIMRLGQGCQKRTPWWCWMIFVTLAAVVLPGAAFVVNAADAVAEKKIIKEEETNRDRTEQKTDAIQALPFYDPLKRAMYGDNRFSQMYSTDLPYLSAEIDMRAWISRIACIRSYPIQELLEKAGKNMGPMRAEAVLTEKLNARIKLLKEFAAVNERPDFSTSVPVYIGTHQFPLKDERKQYHMVSYGGSRIRNDQLIVWSKDDRYHRLVVQALDELAREEMTPFVLTAKFISVPRGLLDKISSERRPVKVYQAEKTAVVSDAAGEQPELIGPETISHPSLICEILDEKRTREVQRMIKSSADTQTLSAPQIRFIDGQTVQLETKKRHELEPEFRGAGQSFSMKHYDVGLDLRVTFSTGKGIQNRGMLDYQIISSEYGGLKKQKLNHPESGLSGEIEFPVITEWHFKDARLLEPGQVLLVEGLGLQQEADSPSVLLALFQVDRARADERKLVMWGEGVNSDAGVTGQLQLDESHFKDALVTLAYPVANLVVPVSRQLILGSNNTPYNEQPRFEPLIELIKQNVTPEAWGDSRKTGRDIRPYPEKLSLVIRAKRATHDQIKALLAKIRAAQERQIGLKLDLVTADYLHTELKKIDQFASPPTRELWQKLKSETLDEGVLLKAPETKLLLKMSSSVNDMEYKMSAKVTFFNGQSCEFNLLDSLVPDQKSKSLLQLRPELLKDQQIRISYLINARNALDALSHVESATIPPGQTLLVDITDQLSRDRSSFQFDQFVKQAELSYQKQPKRCFMLVTPTILTASAEVPEYRDPQHPQQPHSSEQEWHLPDP
ncbi:M56 family metallopeptidase [Gimesia maris]|uniref:M56 family metallopeptidase n=1 Tax=Gimesia maris TaxID=122 RepID=UPI0030D8E672|tara:strand:- start:57581 stop:60979 length:3399 start_codon:yes stop_codon:yes gene_type:complete